MPFKCLIIDPMHSSIIPLLSEIGIEPVYKPEITRKEVLEIIQDYPGLMLRSKLTVDKEILDRAGKLKFIARAGAGMDQIDVADAESRGIVLFNASEGNMDAVGEHAIGMLLCLMNNIRTGDREVRNKQWRREENRGYEIGGKTVGIVGYGYMGRSFARKISSFGCNIVAYDIDKKNFSDGIAQEVSLETLKEQSDIVSFHIPLNAHNKNLVNLTYLQGFKKSIWLVNTARGEILETSALIEQLKSGKILGACLDVLENEKLNTLTPKQAQELEFLFLSDQVIFTPHVAGWTHESYYKINKVLAGKIKNSNILYNY